LVHVPAGFWSQRTTKVGIPPCGKSNVNVTGTTVPEVTEAEGGVFQLEAHATVVPAKIDRESARVRTINRAVFIGLNIGCQFWKGSEECLQFFASMWVFRSLPNTTNQTSNKQILVLIRRQKNQ
jgi:hypothetical protein